MNYEKRASRTMWRGFYLKWKKARKFVNLWQHEICKDDERNGPDVDAESPG